MDVHDQSKRVRCGQVGRFGDLKAVSVALTSASAWWTAHEADPASTTADLALAQRAAETHGHARRVTASQSGEG